MLLGVCQQWIWSIGNLRKADLYREMAWQSYIIVSRGHYLTLAPLLWICCLGNLKGTNSVYLCSHMRGFVPPDSAVLDWWRWLHSLHQVRPTQHTISTKKTYFFILERAFLLACSLHIWVKVTTSGWICISSWYYHKQSRRPKCLEGVKCLYILSCARGAGSPENHQTSKPRRARSVNPLGGLKWKHWTYFN